MLTRRILLICAFWAGMVSAHAQEFSKVSASETDSVSQYVLPGLLEMGLELSGNEKEKLYTLYRKYFEEQKKAIRCSYYTLNNLARAAATIVNQEAFECLNIMMVSNQRQLRLKHHYFERISEEVNGTAALAFQELVNIRLFTAITPVYGFAGDANLRSSRVRKLSDAIIPGRETTKRQPVAVTVIG